MAKVTRSVADGADEAEGICCALRDPPDRAGDDVNPLELVLVLLAAAVALAVASQRLGVPYPILLVIGGLVLAFVPGLPPVEIDPPLVLLIFLPPPLFAAAWFTSWRDFHADLRNISLLAVGLVIATTTVVAAAARALIPGMQWPAAFVLGAIVSPPDAVAASAVLQRLKVPRRIVTIIEGESLVNDATGLVAYRFAVAAVASGSFSLADAGLRFLLVAAGGVAFGLLVGWLIAQVHRRLDDFLVESVITLLTPYVAYIPAEHLGVSGVLATVAAGGFLGWRNPQLLSALTRFRSRGVWSVLLMLVNGLVFILIGLELGRLRAFTIDVPWGLLVRWSALIAGVTIAVRLAWVPLGSLVPRLLSPRVRRREPPPRWPNVALVAWTGMRGIVSLALALGLPQTLPDGRPFPHRSEIIVITFAVIMTTLLLQGLSLPLLIRGLRVADDGVDLREEREGLIRATERALTRLEEIDRTTVIDPALLERLRAPYQERLERLQAELQTDPECRLTEGQADAYRRLRDELLGHERRAVVELRNQGKLSEDVLHRLQEGIDLEALQPDR
jgi:monovalent cation/hydrogen antiporter